jgi:predicted porin
MILSTITVRRALPALAFGTAALLAPAAYAGDFTFGGKVFADISQLQQRNHVAHTDSRAWDGDLKRLYLDADYAFDPAWSAHVTTDINWLRGERDAVVWLKHAYLQRQWSNHTRLRLGVDDMPVLSLTSQWYGYRYIDSIATSMQKIDDAADWGVHLKGELAPQLDYAVAVVTGGGYKRPTHNHRADVEAVVTWHASAHTMLALGGYDGQLAASDDARPLYHTARRLDLLAGYADDTWRLGMRYSYASNWASLYSVASERTGSWSAWASVQLAPQWSVFARYDNAQPTRLREPSRRATYANAGVQWQPVKPLRLALAYKRNALRHDDGELRRSNEVGIWSEFSF